MSEITIHTTEAAGSPFEAIRCTTEVGGEYWSARDLMPLLGYDQWRRFADAIERAKTSAQAQGYDVEQNFAGVGKVSGSRGPTQQDFHLSRFACYLVAMNGDPRKSEVAAAQAYFAIRTREAEVATPKQLTGPALMAAALIEAQKTLDEANNKVRELAPKARQFDNFLSSVGDYSVTEAAQILCRAGAKTGRNRLHNTLADIGWLYKPKGHRRWRAYQTAVDAGRIRLRPTTWRDQETGEEHPAHTVRITPKGLDALAHHFNVIVSKEIAA